MSSGGFQLGRQVGDDDLGKSFVGESDGGRLVRLRALPSTLRFSPEAVQRQASGHPDLVPTLGIFAGDDGSVVVHPFEPSVTAATLLEHVVQKGKTIPVHLSLLIVERLGFALSRGAAATGAPAHGLVLPHWVQLTHEGRVQLLGAELSPVIRPQVVSTSKMERLCAYCSPEVRAGKEIDPADDVYALGALLLALLLNRPLVKPSDLRRHISEVSTGDAAQQAALHDLLSRSLSPGSQRIESAAEWHEEIHRIFSANAQNANAFHLAFYLHSLFRADFDAQGEDELKHQRLREPLLGDISPLPLAAPSEESGSVVAAAPAADPQYDAFPAASARQSLKWIALAATVIAIVGVLAYFLWIQRDGITGTTAARQADDLDQISQVEVDPAQAPPADPLANLPDDDFGSIDNAEGLAEAPHQLALPTAADRVADAAGGPALGDRQRDEEATTVDPFATTVAPPTPEEKESELRRLIDRRTLALENDLRSQYDEQITALQKQLQEAQQIAEERRLTKAQERLREEREQPVEIPFLSEEGNAPAGLVEPPVQTASTVPVAAEIASPAGAGKATEAAERARRQVLDDLQPLKRSVQYGDLVAPGTAGLQAPEPIRLVEPSFPSMAKRLRREASIRVRVLVGPEGKVERSELLEAKVGLGFDEAALEAARRASFRPATKDGVAVRSWTVLRIEFRNP